MYDFFKKNNIELYRASYTWYDLDKKIFSHAWTFDGTSWIRCHDIIPDAIFDKTSTKTKHNPIIQNIATVIPFVNPLHFSGLVDNKRFLPLLFSQHTKNQINILDKKNIADILLLSSDHVVIKPAESSGGKDVSIMSKQDAYAFMLEQADPYSWIVQEFIDSKNGIPEIMEGTHDLRVVMVNKKISYTYYRQPPKNSLLANLALGGIKK